MGIVSAAEPVRVAVIFPKTGTAAAASSQNFDGIRFGAAELNAAGGLLGHPVELVELDNRSTALGSKFAAEEAAKSNVVAVIGAGWSAHSLAMAPVLQQAGIPMISPASTSPELTKVGDYIFRVCFTDLFQGRVMADFARRDLKAGTAVVLVNTSQRYSVGLATVFAERFGADGGTVAWQGEYLQDASDFAEILSRTRAVQPDVIYLPGYSKDSGLLMKQARDMGITAVFLGGDAWGDPVRQYGGPAVIGAYIAESWHRDDPRPASRDFVRKFEAQYSRIRTNVVPLGYDALMLLAQAVRQAGSLERGRIRDALGATREFPAVTGTFSLDANRDPLKPAVVLKLDDTGTRFVRLVAP